MTCEILEIPELGKAREDAATGSAPGETVVIPPHAHASNAATHGRSRNARDNTRTLTLVNGKTVLRSSTLLESTFRGVPRSVPRSPRRSFTNERRGFCAKESSGTHRYENDASFRHRCSARFGRLRPWRPSPITAGVCAAALPHCARETRRVPVGSGYRTIYAFAGGSDGAQPEAGLLAVNGALLGTTYVGGNATSCSGGCGTVFRVRPSGTEHVLHRFSGGSDGANPLGGLVEIGQTFYGTTVNGGASSDGTVFTVNPFGAERVLYAFTGCARRSANRKRRCSHITARSTERPSEAATRMLR